MLVPDGPAGCPGAALGLGFAGEPRQFRGAFWKAGLARRVTSASQVAASRRGSTGEAPGSRPQRRLLSRRAPGPPAGLSLALLSPGGPWQERRLSSERRAWVMRRGDPRGLMLPGLLPCAGFPAGRCGAANEALTSAGEGRACCGASLPGIGLQSCCLASASAGELSQSCRGPFGAPVAIGTTSFLQLPDGKLEESSG